MKNPPIVPPSTGPSTLRDSPLVSFPWSVPLLCGVGPGTIIVVGEYVRVLVTIVKIVMPWGSVVGTCVTTVSTGVTSVGT